MLTRLSVENWKRFDRADIELGEVVVFVGPNNSGKTSALQALALWELGLKRWNEKRAGKAAPEKRPGVTINRRDLLSLPVPDANLLWKDLHVQDKVDVLGKLRSERVRIRIAVEGATKDRAWRCGFEFDYANEESFYCRPERLPEEAGGTLSSVPEEASGVRVAFLPPMSGLSANETRLDPGAIAVRIGEGRTAEVLRNLCWGIFESGGETGGWSRLTERIRRLFGVSLDEPVYVRERGEVEMTYRDPSGVRLDLSCAGRGLHQTLLLLATLEAHPGTVLLLDEPDAHLEMLRQREMYHLVTDLARQKGSQVIAATHSEVVLNEAAERDVVIAFVGSPHRVDDRGREVRKALREIGFDQFYQAECTGWVLYLPGASDLAVMRALAETLEHPAARVLAAAFVHYVGSQPAKARDHFSGLRQARPSLSGLSIVEAAGGGPVPPAGLVELGWRRGGIEGYVAFPEVLLTFARHSGKAESAGPLFEEAGTNEREAAMKACLLEVAPDEARSGASLPPALLGPLLAAYDARLGLPSLHSSSVAHALARFVPARLVDPEVAEKLDAVVTVAAAVAAARP